MASMPEATQAVVKLQQVSAVPAVDGVGGTPTPPSESVSAWLESIGRQEYAAAFSDNFKTLADLRLATRRESIPAVLEACGVKGMGDKAALGEALEALMSTHVTGKQPQRSSNSRRRALSFGQSTSLFA